MHFGSVRVAAELSTTTGSGRYYKLYTDEIELRNETESQTPRMDFVYGLAYIGMHFESVSLGVKLNSTTGSEGYYELHADEVEARNETVWQTPRVGFTCALAHFGKNFKSVRVGAKLFS